MSASASQQIINAGPSTNPIQDQIYQMFSTSIFVPNRLNVQDTPLYDQIVLAAGTTLTPVTTAFFSNVEGNSGKTIGQTNLSQNRLLPSPQAFSILAFSLYIQGDILRQDLINLYSNLVFEFYLGDGKTYHQAPIYTIAAAGGIFAQDNVTGSTLYSNGWPSRDTLRKLALPLVIENNLSFYAQLNGGLTTGNPLTLTTTANGGTGLTMTCVLHGFWAKGVQ
jgi:hypothetical protein